MICGAKGSQGEWRRYLMMWKGKEARRVNAELETFQAEIEPQGPWLPLEAQGMLECIHENLFDPELSVKTLRARCGLRDNNVSSRFRWVTGKTIREYIESLRMEAASFLLRRCDCAVFDVALSVGYNHPQTFYRAFEKTFDCTPAVYRERFNDGRGDGG